MADKKKAAVGATVGAIALAVGAYLVTGSIDCSPDAVKARKADFYDRFAGCAELEKRAGRECLATLDADFQKTVELCKKP
jgi:hypothetical protein